jgi:hypothetical protein
VIRLGGESYTVQDISYGGDTPTVILVDSNVLSGGGCPAVHNISFDGKWLRNSNSNDILTFYFGCYSPETPVPRELEKYQINCNGSQRPVPAGGVAFVLTTDDYCWGIRNRAFRTLKIKECFSRSDSRAKGPAPKPQEPLNPLIFQNSSFGLYPSSPAGLSNELRKTQGVRVFDQADCFLP